MKTICITVLISLAGISSLQAGPMLDPTRPPGARAAAPAPSVIRLEAIVVSDSSIWAIVNGTVVHRGDHIANAVIDEINHTGIRYTRNGKSESLQLPHLSITVRHNETSHEEAP
jgi:hypothetical protein